MSDTQIKSVVHQESEAYPFLSSPVKIIQQEWDKYPRPLVSINCVTYKHELFIEEAIKSFLNQKTTFKVEILIHDDASPDDTAKIVRQYEEKYPHIIDAIYQVQNQYAIGKRPELYNLQRSHGKYIAICDGDDYWIDPLKLEKQVKFLEKNPEFSTCVGAYKCLKLAPEEKIEVVNVSQNLGKSNGFAFSLEEMKKVWLTKTLTAVFRKNVLMDVDLYCYKHFRDVHLFYHTIKNHQAYYFPDVLGVYRIHEGGISSMKQNYVKNIDDYKCYRELYTYNKDEFTRNKCLRSTLGLLNFNLFNSYKENSLLTNIQLFGEAVLLIRSLSEVKMFFAVFLKREWKNRFKK